MELFLFFDGSESLWSRCSWPALNQWLIARNVYFTAYVDSLVRIYVPSLIDASIPCIHVPFLARLDFLIFILAELYTICVVSQYSLRFYRLATIYHTFFIFARLVCLVYTYYLL